MGERENDREKCRNAIREALKDEVELTPEEAEFFKRADKLPVFNLPVQEAPSYMEKRRREEED